MRGREPRRGLLVDTRAMQVRAPELPGELGVSSIRPGSLVSSLSVAQQQIVEIATVISYDARIISMDEPTAALGGPKVGLRYGIIRRLTGSRWAALFPSASRTRDPALQGARWSCSLRTRTTSRLPRYRTHSRQPISPPISWASWHQDATLWWPLLGSSKPRRSTSPRASGLCTTSAHRQALMKEYLYDQHRPRACGSFRP